MWFERAELNKVLDRLSSDESMQQKEQSVKIENESHEKHDSAITKQIYENREMHYQHAHPRSRHWLRHLFR
jgi:Zn-finger nucleic acid-binding protein